MQHAQSEFSVGESAATGEKVIYSLPRNTQISDQSDFGTLRFEIFS
jgi:hypothetical protein